MSKVSNGGGDAKNTLYCSFCGKSQHEVRKLIAGPTVFICDECVELCMDIIREENKTSMVKSREGVPTPQEILAVLDDYVIGQAHAKRVLSVAVHNHYKRLAHASKNNEVELAKSNILLIGPTGCGKTLLAQTLARIIDVPFTMADATTLTEAGYVGEDVENIILKLLQSADYNVERAQRGIGNGQHLRHPRVENARAAVAEDRNGAEARTETTIDGVHQRKLSPIRRRRIGRQRPDDAAAHQRAARGSQQQQWQDPRQDVLLAADAGRAQQRQPLDPRRPPHGEVQRQPRAQRNAEACRARHAQSIEHGLQPGRVRIARQRQPRRRARAGLADQVDRVNAEMRRPGRGWWIAGREPRELFAALNIDPVQQQQSVDAMTSNPWLVTIVLLGALSMQPGSAAAAEGSAAQRVATRACDALSSRVDAIAGTGPAFLQSYDPSDGRVPVLPGAYTYDNALAVIALIACGERHAALRIADALLAASEVDRSGEVGRLRNTYRPGPLTERPVPPMGWWSDQDGRWVEDPYHVGTATGNVAWAALALLTVGIALASWAWHRDWTPASYPAWIPVAVGVASLATVLLLWRALIQGQRDDQQALLGAVAGGTVTRIEQAMHQTDLALWRIAWLVPRPWDGSERWRAQIHALLAETPGLLRVAWVADGRVLLLPASSDSTVLSVQLVPFAVSFTAYFIALHLFEALCLQRLFAGRVQAPH